MTRSPSSPAILKFVPAVAPFIWRGNPADDEKRRGVPAFRIFSDQVLRAMVSRRPASARELLAIPGIGISTVEKYGAQIYRLLYEG